MRRKERTVEDYRPMLNVHLVAFFSDVDVATITRQDVERFMSYLVVERGRALGFSALRRSRRSSAQRPTTTSA